MPAVTPELEIERQLIEQLTSGESQWTYRPDLKNEGHPLQQISRTIVMDGDLSKKDKAFGANSKT